jgi:hypothetical protein
VDNLVAVWAFRPDRLSVIVLVFDKKPNVGDAFAAAWADAERGSVRGHEIIGVGSTLCGSEEGFAMEHLVHTASTADLSPIFET